MGEWLSFLPACLLYQDLIMLIGPGESESEFELNLYLLKKEPGLRPGEEFTQQTVRSLTDPHPALRWLTV